MIVDGKYKRQDGVDAEEYVLAYRFSETEHWIFGDVKITHAYPPGLFTMGPFVTMSEFLTGVSVLEKAMQSPSSVEYMEMAIFKTEHTDNTVTHQRVGVVVDTAFYNPSRFHKIQRG